MQRPDSPGLEVGLIEFGWIHLDLQVLKFDLVAIPRFLGLQIEGKVEIHLYKLQRVNPSIIFEQDTDLVAIARFLGLKIEGKVEIHLYKLQLVNPSYHQARYDCYTYTVFDIIYFTANLHFCNESNVIYR